MTPTPELAWQLEVVVPIDGGLSGWSKNRLWRRGRGGRTYLDPAHRRRRDDLAARIRQRLPAGQPRHNRLWLDVVVCKPDHRGDALNVLDLVADAVQLATGLDDRWYSVASLDWRVRPDRPELHVSVGQEDLQDALVCGRCGRILDPALFGRDRRGKFGRAGTCRRCLREARKRAREPRPPPDPLGDSPRPIDPAPWLPPAR